MKMVIISYNEAADMEVMELLERCGVPNYTKIGETFGRGKSSGTHLGTDIWPGLNNVLFTVCADDRAREIMAGVRALRASLGAVGVKAFVVPVEDAT